MAQVVPRQSICWSSYTQEQNEDTAWKAGKKLGLKFAFFSALFWNNLIPKTLRKSNLKVFTESYAVLYSFLCSRCEHLRIAEEICTLSKRKVVIAGLIQYLVGDRHSAKFFKSILITQLSLPRQMLTLSPLCRWGK